MQNTAAPAAQECPAPAPTIEQAQAAPAKTYNHAFTLAFQIGGSTHAEGDDITPRQFYGAIIARANALLKSGEMEEAIGAPWDSYVE